MTIPLLGDLPEPKRQRFQIPSFDDVQHYCLIRRNGIDPGAFIDYYQSVGWKIGSKPMKDWQAAIRTWERTNGQKVQSNILAKHTDRSWAS